MRSVAVILVATLFFFAGHSLASGASLKQVQTIPLDDVEGRIDHLAIDPQQKRLYVAALGNNSVEVIDLAAGKRVKSIGGMKEPQGVCALGDGRFVVASGEDGKARFFDRDFKLLATIDDLDDADNVRFDREANIVYVGFGEGALAVIDAEKCTKIAEIKLAGHPESFQLESKGDRIYVNVPSARQIAVVDRKKREVIATWQMKEAQANFPMALDDADARLFIACRKPAKMLAIETSSGKTIASIDCAGDADDIFYDTSAKRIYITGGDGSMSVIAQGDADHYRALERISTAPGARTSLYDSNERNLYLAVPHRGKQAAEVRVYHAE